MSAARSRVGTAATGTSSRSGTGTGKKAGARASSGGKDVPKSATATAADLKKEKQKHDFEFESDECKQLRLEIRQARLERENELRILNDAQQQKAKLDQFHELAKAKREALKMELRTKLRQKQDLEEKQSYELKIYKHKVKHLLHEQQTGMTAVRLDSEEGLALLQDSTRATEHHSALETRDLKVALKGAETAHIDFLKTQKIEQEKTITALRTEYEQKHWELREHYEKKQKTTRDSHEDLRREEVARLELKKNTHIADLMAKHKRQFDKLKKYYSDITHANLELIKNLKEEVGDMKKKEAAVQKEVAEIRRINRALSKPLAHNRLLVAQLQKDLHQYRKDQSLLEAIQAEISRVQDRMRNTEWEHEVTAQKLLNLQEEQRAISSKLGRTIYEVQQKTGFRHLLLEKKLSALSQDLEKTESALAEVLASTNLHPEIIGDIQHNLEDVLMAKNKTTQTLEDQLDELKRRYAKTIQLYEAKMAEYQIPREELGFTATRRL